MYARVRARESEFKGIKIAQTTELLHKEVVFVHFILPCAEKILTFAALLEKSTVKTERF